jgi:hexokinase
MNVHEFLAEHSMEPERIIPEDCAPRFLAAMEKGLRGQEGGLPMVPTYLRAEGAVPRGTPAAVIDAGGTNFRRALVTFGDGDYKVEELEKTSMPGVSAPTDFTGFIGYTADKLLPLMGRAKSVGFCFSYMALMTPQRDGYDPRFTKQVKISGCSGRYICRELSAELERRGVSGVSFTLLNDTAAVLLGVSALLEKSEYDGFFGLVSGTGTNTCCMLPLAGIPKLGGGEGSMLVNLESGYMMDLPRGDFDTRLDNQSSDPGRCWHEKMTSGAYLGELCRIALCGAAEEGLISHKPGCAHADAAAADAWCAGEGLESYSEDEREFIRGVCLALFDRAGRCVASNLGGLMLLTGEGREKPVCVCAEGSLFLKSRYFRPALEKHLGEYAENIGRSFVFRTSEDTTLLGSAAAALLNR